MLVPTCCCGHPGKASVPKQGLPLSPLSHSVGRSEISRSTGVYYHPQPGPGCWQHPAEGGRAGCSQLAGLVASWCHGEAREHPGHQGTMVALPAGARGPGEDTLSHIHQSRRITPLETCPHPVAPGRGLRGHPRDGATSCPPRPALGAGSRVQSSQTPHIPLRDPCKCLRAQ